jgi:hypothetical protein
MIWSEYQNVVAQVTDLRREAADVFTQIVLPRRATVGYAQTLYGYMHRTFGFIDALSSYWKGNDANQSLRMVDFLEKYLSPNRRAHSVAVQVWRHKLVHTALPRALRDSNTGRTMHYMIQWHESQMQPEQPHYSIVSFGHDEVFNLACISMLEDLERVATNFATDLGSSRQLASNAAKFSAELEQYTLRAL